MTSLALTIANEVRRLNELGPLRVVHDDGPTSRMNGRCSIFESDDMQTM